MKDIANKNNETKTYSGESGVNCVACDDEQRFSPFQIGLGLMLVGASAGLTLYTKKTASILAQMKRVEQNQQMRLPKKKFGPPTKREWERIKPRWSDDDL